MSVKMSLTVSTFYQHSYTSKILCSDVINLQKNNTVCVYDFKYIHLHRNIVYKGTQAS